MSRFSVLVGGGLVALGAACASSETQFANTNVPRSCVVPDRGESSADVKRKILLVSEEIREKVGDESALDVFGRCLDEVQSRCGADGYVGPAEEPGELMWRKGPGEVAPKALADRCNKVLLSCLEFVDGWVDKNLA